MRLAMLLLALLRPARPASPPACVALQTCTYVRLTSGTCFSHGYQSVDWDGVCDVVDWTGIAEQHTNWKCHKKEHGIRPWGCYEFNWKIRTDPCKGSGIYGGGVNEGTGGTGAGKCTNDRACLCYNQAAYDRRRRRTTYDRRRRRTTYNRRRRRRTVYVSPTPAPTATPTATPTPAPTPAPD